MCAWAARFSASAVSDRTTPNRMRVTNLDICARRKGCQQAPQIAGSQRHASCRRQKPGARHMDENGTAAIFHARAGVVIELDHQIIQMIITLQSVARTSGRKLDRAVVAPIVRVLAPAVVVSDRAYGQARLQPRRAVSAPPKAEEAEAPTRRRAVALALVGSNPAAAKRNRNRHAMQPQQTACAIARRMDDTENRALLQPFPPVHVSNRCRRPHLPRPVPWSSSAPSNNAAKQHQSGLLAGSG